MDKIEKAVVILILLTFGFLIFCISEYEKFGFYGKTLAATLGNAATILSFYLFLKSKE